MSEKFKKEHGETGLRFIKKEIAKRPPSLDLLHKKAGLELTLGNGREGIKTYKATLALNPWFLPAYLRIGYEYMRQKRIRQRHL